MMHETGTFVKFIPGGAELFVSTLYDLDSRLGAWTHEVRVIFKGSKTPRKDARHNEPALAKEVCDHDGCLLIWQLLKSLDEFAHLHSRNQNVPRRGNGAARSLALEASVENSRRP